jgi:hypothetical protein
VTVDLTFRPMLAWPGAQTPYYQRQRAKFNTPYNKTVDLLERELGMLAAKEIVVQVALEPRDFTGDHQVRSSARRPSMPGVVLTFVSQKTRPPSPLSFPCDRFDNWEDNLRAVALSLEALRLVDRYGVTRSAEQYRGFAALPNPAGMTTQQAAEFLAGLSRESAVAVMADRNAAERARRSALANAHPDTGGSAQAFQKVQEAAAVLAKHHGQ